VTHALLIANPAAARTDARAVRAVRDTLRAGGWMVDVLATAKAGDARRFASEARAAGIDVVVAYGGDGTAMQAVAGLVGGTIPLGLVPGGTGNILAGNLRLPRDPTAAARAILGGRTRALDLGVVERADGVHYFAVCCGTGFDADLMAATRAEDKRRWKMAAYVASAMPALRTIASEPYRVIVDGEAREVPAAMVLVANCGELVPPFVRLRRAVAYDDGWLDVIAVRADGALDAVAAMWDILRRRNGAGHVWYGRGREIQVEPLGPHGPRAVQLDGEVVGEAPFTARLAPGAVSVLVGEGATSRG